MDSVLPSHKADIYYIHTIPQIHNLKLDAMPGWPITDHRSTITLISTTITIYFIHPSRKLKHNQKFNLNTK